jgi:hypothetical protein
MPGYRAIPQYLTGKVADLARDAGVFEDVKDYEGALRTYEEALVESLTSTPVLPGFLCGRLAALYRRLERYHDEVELLEAYRKSQTSEAARTRYDARLCKARAIAARKQRADCGALASVRAIKRRKPIRLPNTPEGLSSSL